MLPISSITTRYQITVEVLDEPGVLAAIAAVFLEHGVSVETLEQTVPETEPGSEPSAAAATLVIGTHRAAEADLAATVAALTSSSVVHRIASVLRVEGLS